MSWIDDFASLLADYYRASYERVAGRASIKNISSINKQRGEIDVWYDIVKLAKREEKLYNLSQVVIDDYPNRKEELQKILISASIPELPEGDRSPVIKRQKFEPETVYVAAGTFRMGRPAGPLVWDNESPPSDVNLPAFRIGRYPVTNTQYFYFFRETGCRVTNETGWELSERGMGPSPGTEEHPVVGISWDDAVEYCVWLKKNTGRGYRLPSEAEWEYASRGNDGRYYPWGTEFESSNCNCTSTGIGKPTPVRQYSPNGDSPWQCADMAGNVWEWTNTLWGRTPQNPDYAYPYEPGDGREKSAALEPFREFRICRGGSFADPPDRVTCTARTRNQANSRKRRLGFRVAMDL
jgi:toxoflavin biosynthesis protein ToxD